MITVAKRDSSKIAGQSVLEFILFFPVLVGFALILIRVNSAIQTSIVYQQYARAQALTLTWNSPYYPDLNLKRGLNGANQMVLGVANDQPPNEGGSYSPEASAQKIVRSPRVNIADPEKTEPRVRANVRIRDTVTLCTQNYYLSPTQAISESLPGGIMIPENAQFNYLCGSELKYE